MPWGLVGRDEELELIAEAMSDPAVHAVVIAGAAGVGKTRLSQEAISRADAAGRATEQAVATESAATIPFGAVAHLLPRVGAGLSDRLELLRMAAEALAARGGSDPLVLAVDDAHLLDSGSAALVHRLAATGVAFVVATVRTGEPAPDAVVALWKDGLGPRVELQVLGAPEVDEMVAGALEGQVERGTLLELREVSGGNPLFLRELVLGGLGSGALDNAEGVWRWRGRIRVSGGLRELVRDRIGEMRPEERRALELLAFGEPLGVDVVESVVEPAIVEGLAERGLVHIGADRRRAPARLAHPLYAEVLREDTPALRARNVHRALADALEATGAHRGGDGLRVAVWSLDGGRPVPAATLIRGARRALRVFDYALAERLARAALALEPEFESQLALGQALVGQRRAAEGEAVLAVLEDAATTDMDRIQLAATRATNLHGGLGRADDAHAVLDRAAAAITDDSLRIEFAAVQASLEFQATPAVARRTAARVLEASSASGRAKVLAAASACLAAAACGQPLQGLDLLDGLGDLEDAAGAFFAPGLLLTMAHWLAFLFAGRLADAGRVARDAYDAAPRREDTTRGYWAHCLGHTAYHRGRIREAAGWLAEANVVLKEAYSFTSLTGSVARLAEVQALGGDVETAETTLSEARTYPTSELPSFASLIYTGDAWIAAAKGEASRALGLACQAADAARDCQHYGLEAVALHDVARLGAPERVIDRLGELAGDLDGPLLATHVSHARALLSADVAGLEAAASAYESMDTLLLAAEAYGDTALAHLRAGRTSSWRAARGRALALADLCEGARTPALARLELPERLTAREREVAGLAVSGMTSPDIAQRLVISVRTVENHLQQAYTKLGVRNREQLASVPGVGPPGADVDE